MRTLLAALLLLALALPVAAQEPDNGLLVYGALANVYGGGGLYALRYDTYFQGYGEFNLVSAGIGHHRGGNGWMVSTCLVSEAPSGENGDWMFTMGVLPVFFHVVGGATRDWTSREPTLHAYAGVCPLAMTPYVEAGAEAKWRFYAASPSVRATWRWTQGGHIISLCAGLELGGIWALGRHE